MTRLSLIFALAMTLLVSGCAVTDALRTPVDTAAAEAKVAQLDQDLVALRAFIATQTANIDQLKAFIADQTARLVDARKLAEESKSAAALAVVTTLEQMQATAQAGLSHAQQLLAGGEKYLPELQDIVATQHAGLIDLKQGGDRVPLWVMLGTLALPFVPKLAALIPGAGPVLGPIAGQLANSVWQTLSTSHQKTAEAQTEAKAKALDYQVDVTHGILAKLSDPIRKDAGVDDFLQSEKARQIVAGVHDTLKPLVAAAEVAG